MNKQNAVGCIGVVIALILFMEFIALILSFIVGFASNFISLIP